MALRHYDDRPVVPLTDAQKAEPLKSLNKAYHAMVVARSQAAHAEEQFNIALKQTMCAHEAKNNSIQLVCTKCDYPWEHGPVTKPICPDCDSNTQVWLDMSDMVMRCHRAGCDHSRKLPLGIPT